MILQYIIPNPGVLVGGQHTSGCLRGILHFHRVGHIVGNKFSPWGLPPVDIGRYNDGINDYIDPCVGLFCLPKLKVVAHSIVVDMTLMLLTLVFMV